MPILGVIASGISGNLYSASFDSIATLTQGAGGGNFVFSNIPQTYTHLQLRGMIRGERTGGLLDDAIYRFNGGDANSTTHAFGHDGSSIYATGNAASSYASLGAIASDSSPANVFSGFVMDIYDYASTSKRKTALTHIGFSDNSTWRLRFSSSVQLTSSAVTSITFICGNTEYAQHSTIALYGIKGS